MQNWSRSDCCIIKWVRKSRNTRKTCLLFLVIGELEIVIFRWIFCNFPIHFSDTDHKDPLSHAVNFTEEAQNKGALVSSRLEDPSNQNETAGGEFDGVSAIVENQISGDGEIKAAEESVETGFFVGDFGDFGALQKEESISFAPGQVWVKNYIFSWIVCEFSIHFRRANNNKPLKCADKNEFGEGSVSAIIDLDSDSDESN